MGTIKFFDSHAHYEDARFDPDRDEVLSQMHAEGVEYILNAGSDQKTSQESVSLAQRYNFIYTAVGIHPHEVKDTQGIDWIRDLCRSPKVVAIGEIGLDYYYDHSPRDIQKTWFKKQIALANELHLPVIIHDRDAHGDCLHIVKHEVTPARGGVFHCFSGSVDMARELLEMGFHISFGGSVTFENARRLQEVVRYVPLENMLIETDAPYLTPHPFRGKRNDSRYLGYIVERIAGIKGVTVEETAGITLENAKRLFKIS